MCAPFKRLSCYRFCKIIEKKHCAKLRTKSNLTDLMGNYSKAKPSSCSVYLMLDFFLSLAFIANLILTTATKNIPNAQMCVQFARKLNTVAYILFALNATKLGRIHTHRETFKSSPRDKHCI